MIYPANKETLQYAIPLLSEGEVIVYPTDTLYGFGVDATNTDSIKKLNALKGRTQPLSIVIKDLYEITDYGEMDEETTEIVSKLLPGPYTIIIPKIESNLSHLVTYGSPFVGIRIPDHPFPKGLVEELGKPVISTSINQHAKDPLNNVSQVELDFPDIAIFEDHDVKHSLGSTIINFSTDTDKIVRMGDGKYPL